VISPQHAAKSPLPSMLTMILPRPRTPSHYEAPETNRREVLQREANAVEEEMIRTVFGIGVISDLVALPVKGHKDGC